MKNTKSILVTEHIYSGNDLVKPERGMISGVIADLEEMRDSLAKVPMKVSYSLDYYLKKKKDKTAKLGVAKAAPGWYIAEVEENDSQFNAVALEVVGGVFHAGSFSYSLVAESGSKYASTLIFTSRTAERSSPIMGIFHEILMNYKDEDFKDILSEERVSLLSKASEVYKPYGVRAEEPVQDAKEYTSDLMAMTAIVSALMREDVLSVVFDNKVGEAKEIPDPKYTEEFNITEKYHGKFFLFSDIVFSEDVAVEEDVEPEDYFGKYARKDHPLNVDDLNNIERNKKVLLEQGIKLHPIAEEIARDFVMNPAKPFLYLLEGDSGSGKSTIVRQLAVLLDLPYRAQSIRGDSDTASIVGGYAPRVEGRVMPDEEMMEFNPEEAYRLLKGFDFQPTTAQPELTAEILEREYNLAKVEGDFTHVETPITTTFRVGGVCDIQEINTAAPEAAIALNAMFAERMLKVEGINDPIYANENSLFIMTMNPGYRGTEPINESIMSRVAAKYTVNTPDRNEVIDRVVKSYNLDFSDKLTRSALDAMYLVFNELRIKYIEEGYSGIIDFRSFQQWVAATIVTNDPYNTCISRVITKMTDAGDDPEELVDSVLANSTLSRIGEKLRAEGGLKLKTEEED